MTLSTGSGDENAPKDELSGKPADAAAGKDAAGKDAAGKDAAGTSLAPADAGTTGIDPFLAGAAEAPEAAAPRPFYAKALDYSAHAAMIVGLIGFAWTVSDRVVAHQPAAPKPVKLADNSITATPAATAAVTASPKDDEIGELRRTNQKMATDLRNLHASLEALRTTAVRERSTPDAGRATSASLDEMKTELDSARGELASAKSDLVATRSESRGEIASLSAKIDKLQREERTQPVAEHAARPDRQPVDTTTTASIPAPRMDTARAVPTPPAKPTVLASAQPEEPAKPQVIANWVVRDVYQGVALIEGRRGQMEVVPGVSIPGAGVVKSIDRHGAGWTVTTTKGQLAFAAPQRNNRRDYYPQRRYDF